MPELRFVHVVRDVRAVVASVLARPWGPADAASAAAWWARTQQEASRWAKLHPGSLLELRYEDLLHEPEETLASALAFLGEDPDPGPILSRRTIRPDRGREEAWRDSLTDHQLAETALSCGPPR